MIKRAVFTFCIVLLLTAPTLAQAPGYLQTSGAAEAVAENPNRAGIDAALKAYVNAYERKSTDDLIAVWPDLINQKKEYKKIKDLFSDPEVSEAKVILDGCDARLRKDDAVVKCQRTEQIVKTVRETQWLGDATIATVQRPTPWQIENKRTIKKQRTIWLKLHKSGDGWRIASLSEKQISL